jgi:hypothetical protein
MKPLTDEQLDSLAGMLPLIKAWVSAVEEQIELRLTEGASFKHVGLASKKAIRKWKDSEEMIRVLQNLADLDLVAPRSPLPPAQAEKKLGRVCYMQNLSEYVLQESSGVTLKYIDSEN